MATATHETRFFNVELRSADDGAPLIGGYASVYETDSSDLGFIETMKTGAFEGRTSDDVVALFNHNADFVLARTTSGTLQLRNDERGLYFEAQLDTTDPDTERVLSKIRRGDVHQCSFAFTVAPGGDRWFEDGNTLRREINTVGQLFDVSVVTYPAYPDTSCFARDLVTAYAESRDGKPLTDAESVGIEPVVRSTEPEQPVVSTETREDEQEPNESQARLTSMLQAIDTELESLTKEN
jgi:HK97 family phage prohead protease